VFNIAGPDRLRIVADDLTGACDAAVAFANRGIHTEVSLDPHVGLSHSNVIATCTGTRDVPPAIAATTIEDLAADHWLSESPQLFKKIDSVFRGNTFVEIAAVVRAFPNRFAVIAPASPRHGRTCVNGILRVKDVSGHRSTLLRHELEQHGLTPRYINAGFSLTAELLRAHQQNASAAFCDATSDHDLAVIVEAARSLQVPILWIGSSGLAHALAATFPPQSLEESTIRSGQLVLLNGSDHPVSVAQLDHLEQQSSISVTTIPIVRGDTTNEQIRRALSHLSPEDLSCLVLNGGDTALQVCRALAIDTLELRAEFAPGVPQAIAHGGRFDGATVLLKSGGFGATDLFAQIARQAHQECHA
jgi:D-threonate/D-erythronate kinase